MSGDDNHDVGLSVDWSEQGFSAKIKSRLLSAFDRLGARRIDASNLAAERKSSVGAALTETQVDLIKAASRAIEKQVEHDPKLAAKLLHSLSRAERDAANTGASLDYALEDLRNDPSSEAEAANQDDTLSAETVNRWSRYASEAETDVVREKWGKVLASEIRSPGTFSLQTLRIIDEIDGDVARVYERFCSNRINSWVPVVTAGISDSELDELQQAGLISRSEFPASITFDTTTKGDGTEWWVHGDRHRTIAVSKAAPSPSGGNGFIDLDDIRISKGELQINVYALTRAGRAIASIVPDDGRAVTRLADVVAKTIGSEHVVLLRRNADEKLVADDEWQAPKPSEPGIRST